MSDAASHNSTTPALTETADNWSLSAFLADPRSQFPGYLWEPFLPRESVVMLAADPFSGKSMLALGLGLALAGGKEFLGVPVQQANVLYLGIDSACWDYGAQIRKLLGSRDVPKGFHFLSESVRVPDTRWRARLGSYIVEHGIRLVVLDTLRAMHDKEENDSGDMQAVMNELRAICAEYGVAVLFLHHRPKPGEGGQGKYRGSSVILGSADVFVSLVAESPGANVRLLTLTCEKGRGVKAQAPIVVKLTWDDNAGTASLDRATHNAPVPIRSLEAAVDGCLVRGPATIEELVALVPSDGRAPKTIRNKVDAYLKSKKLVGLVEAEVAGGRNVWHLTREAGKEVG